MSDSLQPHGLYIVHGNSPGQNTGVGSLSLLQGIFPTQGLNPGLLHCGWILYQLSHKRRPTCTCMCAKSLQSCTILQRSQGLYSPPGSSPWDSPGKNTGVGCHALLQGIFPTQAPNLPLLPLLHWQVGS